MGFLKEFAIAAEALGFDALYLPEHVVFFRDYTSRYPYTEDGAPSFPPDTGIYDPLLACAVASSVTTTLRMATSVLILPERPALLTAKEVMTLDHLSGGRFDLGVGVGWSSEEYAALGVPWHDRGRRMDDHIAAIRAAWTKDVASHDGPFVSFEGAVLRPAPLRGSVPIIVGGNSLAAVRRAARLGDGWYGWWAGFELEPQLAMVRACLEREGRSQGPGWSLRLGLPVGAETPDEVAVRAREAAALGVDELVLGAAIPTRGFDAHLRTWAEALGVTPSTPDRP
jgi:probable F420-dependent oxidoreductase